MPCRRRGAGPGAPLWPGRASRLRDLALLLSYWSEAGDPEAMHDLQQMPTADRGFPEAREDRGGLGRKLSLTPASRCGSKRRKTRTRSSASCEPASASSRSRWDLPRGLAENAERFGLVIAELDPPLRRKVSLVTRPGPLSPAAKVFAELARGAAA